MTTPISPATGLLAGLEPLHIRTGGPLMHIELARPAERNSINDTLVAQLHTAFVNLPADTRAAVIQALPRIADVSASGLFMESLLAAIAQGDDAAKQRTRAFLEGKAGKVKKESA